MPQLVEGATIAIVTAVVVFLVIGAGGLWLISRRSRRRPRGGPRSVDALATRANILLVRLDDSIKSGEEELGFAFAQFGESATKEFAAATAAAKADLAEAFRLKQRLDDAEPDSATQTREWNARVIHLCEKAQRSLDEQSATFAGLRRSEEQAPQTLAAVRALVDATAQRVASAERTLTALQAQYAATAVATVAGNAEQARGLLASAAASADRAEQLFAAGVGAAAVAEAQADAQHAAQLIDAIESAQASLAASVRRLEALVGSASADLAEAAAARDSPPDPDSGAAIGRAMAELERAIEESGGSSDPVEGIEWIERAATGLDTALAGARNQAQRLAHAKQALVGALITARSQIQATDSFIGTRRGGVGADARTRLAEARRLLALAETESDPVLALDTARSSATYSRDADALARYDVLR
ncbi:hypothetical protein BH09ACT3_BH09ACT3_06850 [soil metagenome]